MAKKKDKPQIINNIKELNLEIDYDKLAEAIVKAQDKSNSKAKEELKYMSGTFAIVTATILRCIAVLIAGTAFVIPFRLGTMLGSLKWNGFKASVINVANIGFETAMIAVLALYSYLLFKCAKEIQTEKDRHYVVSVFSGIVSFVALVVALVALFKGVG